jgi:nitrate/nitrite transporter NarK
VIGAPLAALLLTYYGWRALFLITGLVSLVWVVPWLVLAPRSDPPDALKARAQAKLSWRLFLRKRETWGFIIGFFGFLYVFYVYLTWFPGYLIIARHFSIIKGGSVASLSFLVQSLGGLFGGWMADRLIQSGHSPTSVRKSFILTGLGLGLAIVPAALVASVWHAVGLFMVSMGGIGVAASNCIAVPAGLAPKGLGGTVGGLHSMAGNLGGIVAPAVTGVIYGLTHSFVLALMVAGGMLVVSGIGYCFLIKRIEPMEITVPIAKEPLIAKEQAGCH